MRNLTEPARWALQARLLTRKRLSGALQKRMETTVSPYAPAGWCAGVRRTDGSPEFAFGGEAIRSETAASRDSIFRVASVSKVITAAAAASLARAGKLDLDGDAGEMLGFPIRPAITPRQLLTHTAALSDDAYNRAAETGNFPPLNELMGESFAAWKPGERFAYSNLGAGVAGMLVEKTAEMPFDDYVRRAFFQPYGLDASFHPQRIADKE